MRFDAPTAGILVLNAFGFILSPETYLKMALILSVPIGAAAGLKLIGKVVQK